jgi:hypothetical protein
MHVAVNFLLHRQLALDELSSPVAAIGAMLPDLWRMASRRMRSVAELGDAGDEHELQRGVDHHLEVDRWFHRTEVFLDGERALAAELRAVAEGIPKLSLFAHVGWEMCLDGALLRRGDFARELAALRADVDAVGLPSTHRLAARHGAARWEAPERAAFEARMESLCEHLTEGRWIGGYRDGQGVAQRLEGIRRRVGLGSMSAEQLDRVGEVLARCLDRADHRLDPLLSDRAQRRGVG